MSSIFRIIENHAEDEHEPIQNKSFNINQQQPINDALQQHDVDECSSSLDRQEVLKLQIKQLKMQNKFLRKKINQFNCQKGEQRRLSQRKSITGKGTVQQDIDVNYLNVDFFFKQISNLMNAMADLFKVQFSNEQIKKFSAQFPKPEENITHKKFVIFKKALLARKLQRITFESEQKRYPMLLQVFTNYYKVKEQYDKYIREVVDELSSRVLQLNKMILNNTAKKSMRGSSSKKTIHTFDDPFIFDTQGQSTSPSNIRKHSTPITYGLMRSDVKKRVDKEQKQID